MSRFLGRSARIVTGPLKAVSEPGHSPVPVVSLALMAAVIAAGLALMPRLSRQERPPEAAAVAKVERPVAPEVRTISTAPAQQTAASAQTPAPEHARVETVAVVQPAAVSAAVTPAPDATAAESEPAARAQSAAEASRFQLEDLPVLETGGDDLTLAPAPQKPAAKAAPRRTTAGRSAPTSASGAAFAN